MLRRLGNELEGGLDWQRDREVKFLEGDCISALGLLEVLGTGARISLRYPRARESDRPLLAGREENSILGSVWHSFSFNIGPTEIGVSIRKR